MTGAAPPLSDAQPVAADRRRLLAGARLLRLLGASVIAGAVAGIIAGSASRLAMTLSLMMMGSPGRTRTSNGTIVGQFTLEGTLFLVLGIGLVAGLVGGTTYAVARTWLAPAGRWRGLALGGMLLLAYGRFVFDAHDFDFSVFGPAAANVPLYAALFILFGIVAAPATERILATRSALPLERPIRRRSAAAAVVVHGAGALALVPIVAFTVGTSRGTFFDPRDVGFAIAITVFVAIVWLVPVATRLRDRGGRLRAVGFALAAAPVVVGGFFTLREMAGLLSG